MTTLTPGIARPEPGEASRIPQAYANPYLAGIGLGLVLLSAFVAMGRGLGASGAYNSVVAWLASILAPGFASSNQFLSGYLGFGHPLKEWLVFEVIGVLVGGFLSGVLAGRVTGTVERGPRVSVRLRLVWAFLGGAIMAFGAALARGCASGQALTGGALLNLGSWIFMMCFFGGAYGVAYFIRSQWR